MEKLAKFFKNYDNLTTCSYILFENKLQDLMINLAESDIVYAIISKCLKNYNYKAEKQVYANVKDLTILKSNDKEMVAFGFSLFYEIYNRDISLADVLELYFIGENFMAKYDNFKNNLVLPLRKSLENIVLNLQKLYSEKYGEKAEEESNNLKEELDKIINDFEFVENDKEYFNYFYAHLNNEQKEVSLKAIEFILKKYENGQELLNKILEIF